MGKKIILSESQFKEYMRRMVSEGAQQGAGERELSVEEKSALLHRMIDDDFFIYLSGGKRKLCSYTHEKGEILKIVCETPMPKLNLQSGNISVYSSEYGIIEVENLINAK